jgi:hypothetical protein
MESQQLLPKSQVIQEKFFSGTKAGADPDEQMPKVYKHQGIIAKRAAHRRASKSLILQTCEVLAKHNSSCALRRTKWAKRFSPRTYTTCTFITGWEENGFGSTLTEGNL